MYNYDDLLHHKITDLENGQPLEAVLQDLPEEARDLEPLIRLVAAVKEIPHPEPAAEHAAAQRRQVIAAARLNTRPRPGRNPRTVLNWFGMAAGTGVVSAVAVAIFAVVLVGAGLWLNGRSSGTAQVEGITGQVQVATNREGTAWKNIAAGYWLQSGQRIRTMGASTATLKFNEGTRTQVSANADLTLTKVGMSGPSLQVELTQNAGETANRVVPLKGSQGFFLVHTPSGTASVHGTIFNVKVTEAGQALFAVNKGEVRVQNDGNEVTLLSGQATTASGGNLTAPNYQFTVQGSLIAIQGDTWIVSGVPFQVIETTEITGAPDLGSTITVTGRVLEDGTRVADLIEPGTDDDQDAWFNGTIVSMDGSAWLISGTSVKVTEDTEMDADLAVGSPVKVTFNLLGDGTWLALKIESLVEAPEDPLATPSPTADTGAMPSYTFEPDELGTSACGGLSDFDVTGSLSNTASEAKDYAAGVQLGYLIDRGGEFVDTVEITPDSFERIDPGQTVTFGVRVTTNTTFASAPDDTEIKLRIFIASAINRPDHLNGRLTVTIESGCKATPTVTPGTTTPTVVTTKTPALTPTVVTTPTVLPTQADICTGADPHPTGMKLAQRYNVPYEEIMHWFCQHYGFGEIDLAYSLSRQSGKPVEEIFALRASGMGWGEIKQQLAPEKPAKNGGGDKDNGQDKGKDKDKDKKNK